MYLLLMVCTYTFSNSIISAYHILCNGNSRLINICVLFDILYHVMLNYHHSFESIIYQGNNKVQAII